MDDTHPEIHALQIRLYRQMSAERKIEIIGDLWETIRELALIGIRRRHPEFSPEKQEDELATLMLGPELGRIAADRRRDRAG